MTERTAKCLSEGLFWLLALTGLGECVQGNVVAVERRARTAAPHVFGPDPATHRPPPLEPRP